jgi:quinol-cytochrome oxidoreductase complex cytochrome b subunit
MYETLLVLHSWGRALMVILLLLLFLRHFRAWMGERPYRSSDRVGGLVLTITTDAQLVMGLLLYFVYSPAAKSARANFSESMQQTEPRYWAVEHLAMMVLAIVAIHVGKILSVRSKRDVSKHTWAAIGYGVGLALIVWQSPWPWTTVVREWLRMPG